MSGNGKNKFSPQVLIPATVILLLLLFITAGFRMFRFVLPRAVHGFFFPYLELASKTGGEVSDKYLLSLSRAELAARVELLSMRNRELAVKSAIAAELLDENRVLRRKLRLSAPERWRYTVAEIVLRDPLRYRQGFTIDRGHRDGIARGDTVVQSSLDGRLLLVGIVDNCMARTSHVITIADPELRLSGRTGSSGGVGFTNTGNAQISGKNIRFGMLPLGSSYIQGEAVVTTGFEKGIPGGIKIGELNVSSDINTFSYGGTPDFSAALLPAVDLERLSFVTVISAEQENSLP